MITEPERSWLACVYDSEGSIVIDYQKKYNRKRARLMIYNTDLKYLGHAKSIIDRILDDYSVPIIGKSHPHSVKIQYTITLDALERCRAVLKQIRPYLIIKVDKADEVLNMPQRLKFNLTICKKCNKLRRHSCFGYCRPCGPW